MLSCNKITYQKFDPVKDVRDIVIGHLVILEVWLTQKLSTLYVNNLLNVKMCIDMLCFKKLYVNSSVVTIIYISTLVYADSFGEYNIGQLCKIGSMNHSQAQTF